MKCESEYERMIGESEVLLMSVLVKDMKMPEKCGSCDLFHAEYPMHCSVVKGHKTVGAPYGMPRPEWCPLVEIPERHGRLVDVDELSKKMYHDAFESDTDLQKWDSGCCTDSY